MTEIVKSRPHKPEVFLLASSAEAWGDLARRVEEAGFEARHFSQCGEFLAAWEQAVPDAVLLDWDAPPEGATEQGAFIAPQKGRVRAVPVVVVSRQNDLEARLGAVRAGGTHFLLRPVAADLLAELLRAGVNGVESQPYRVMLVDDDRAEAAAMAAILRQAGMETEWVAEAEALPEAFVRFRPELVLMDEELPGANGFELATLLRQMEGGSDISIVALLDGEERGVPSEVGGENFLIKPVEPQRLTAAAVAKISRYRKMNQAVAGLKGALEKNSLLAAAFGSVESGLMVTDVTRSHQPIIMVNPGFTRLTGYGVDEVMGRTPGFLFGPDTEADVVAKIRATVDAGIPYTFNLLSYRKSGDEFWVEMSLSPVRDDKGRLIHYVWILSDITARKQAGLKLWESEQRYRSLFENSFDGVFSLDQEGRFLTLNPMGERIIGHPEAELVGKPFLPLLAEYDRDRIWKLFRRVLEGEALTGEMDGLNPEGKVTHLEFQSQPIWVKEGVAGAFVIAKDVTERRVYEKVLEENNENLLRASIELERQKFTLDQHAIVSASDPAGNIVYVNDKFCEISQYHREELLGQNHRLLNSSYHSAKFFRKMWDTISHGEVWHGILRNRKKDGSFYWVESTIVPFLDEKGRPYRYLSARTDITERIEAEAKLRIGRETEEALRKILALAIIPHPIEDILDRSLDVILGVSWLSIRPRAALFLMDEEAGDLRMVTQRNLSAAAAQQCERLPLGRCLCGRAAQERMTIYAHCLDSRHENRYAGIEEHGHYSVPIISEGRVLGVLVTYLEHGHAHNLDEVSFLEAVAHTLANVIKRKRTEDELLRAMKLAEQASRAKSDFLSRMSHELRTPMNAILGFAQLMESDPDEPLTTGQREGVEQILKAGWHLLELINEVLDLSRIEAGKLQLVLESVDIADLAMECRSLIAPMAAQRGITVYDQSFELELPRVYADSTRLKQVLLNLLSNAVKYNREEGSIAITYQEMPDNRLRLAVSDTGEGIPEGQLSSLFESFNRLGADDTGVEGTGIGLVITKRLVELMGGSIGVESRPGEGSTFWIELIANPVGEFAPTGKREAACPLPGHGAAPLRHTVLYVEDNPANLKLVDQIVGQMGGIRLLTAPDAITALGLALDQRPDAILADINLPGLDGYELLVRLREREETRSIPALALSANAMPDDVERGLAAGFRHYLTKPVDVRRFREALEEVLEGIETGKG